MIALGIFWAGVAVVGLIAFVLAHFIIKLW
jgi:hypothetical protein